MTTAIIGTGEIGSDIARRLASGGETLRLSSADIESARKLAAEIGRAAVVAVDNRDALQDAVAVVLALRFGVLKDVIGEISEPLPTRSWSFRATRSGSTSKVTCHVYCRMGNPSVRFIRLVACGDALGHGVWNHVGRSIRVHLRPVT